jgi:hypothetical protein
MYLMLTDTRTPARGLVSVRAREPWQPPSKIGTHTRFFLRLETASRNRLAQLSTECSMEGAGRE